MRHKPVSTLTLPIAFRGLFDASFAEPRARARRAENRVSSGRAASTDLLRADRGRARSEGGCITAMALLGESSSSETSSHARSSGAHATAMAPPSIFPISRIPVPVPARARSIAGIDSGSRPRLRGGLCRRPRVGRTRWRRPDARASAKVRRGAWFFPDKYLDKRAHGREKRARRESRRDIVFQSRPRIAFGHFSRTPLAEAAFSLKRPIKSRPVAPKGQSLRDFYRAFWRRKRLWVGLRISLDSTGDSCRQLS